MIYTVTLGDKYIYSQRIRCSRNIYYFLWVLLKITSNERATGRIFFLQAEHYRFLIIVSFWIFSKFTLAVEIDFKENSI